MPSNSTKASRNTATTSGHTNHSLGYNVSAGQWNYSLSGNVEVEDLNSPTPTT
jgi:hypothetical protein